MMKIMLVDDHILFREGLRGLLGTQPDMAIIAEAGTVKDAIFLAKKHQPELILMDIGLPDGSGLDATREILSLLPDTAILIITIHDTDRLLFEALRAGAKGYLLKIIPINKLFASIRGLNRGEAAISRKMTSQLIDEYSRVSKVSGIDDSNLEQLTPREMDVLIELGKGSSNREIAENLYITENTVKIHVYKIFRKLKFQNRNAARQFVRRHSLETSLSGQNGNKGLAGSL